MTTRSEEIARLEAELAKAKGLQADEERVKREAKIDPIRCEIATVLHDMLCSANHIDQCSWGYESWSDVDIDAAGRYHTKTHYYVMARTLVMMLHDFYADFNYSMIMKLTAAKRAEIVLKYVEKMKDIFQKR